ncbi:hypothetical protein [Halobaculum roseum]|uniref:Tat (Twin-arginine translocation) pathway signal sequence n=1 Tax=Halobaculum roseum TaxID=2175149 RepID=A0ABD5MW80_9EURY|nr:hypothetical protein [Halobaculum roseum]QZY01461.1 hypothetical protein K6T36_08895 [Halobaculum roseum]
MHRRDALRAAGGLAATGLGSLAGCVVGRRPPPPLADSFEDGIDAWTTDAAIGPEVPLDEFEWSISPSTERANTGARSVEVFTEGDYDDGIAWLTRPIDTSEVDADVLRVSAHAWSESESFNVLRNLAVRIGPEPPETEEDFPPPETVTTPESPTAVGGLRQPLHRVEGWDEYRFEWQPSEVPDELHLSVGVAVVWEADATHYIDDVRVEEVR